MIFNSIELHNFRQYRDVEFEFPTDDHAITLLIARNGVGKTTLLQAFRFCFYGESPNYLKLAEADKLMNNSKASEMHQGQTESVWVSVQFSHAGDQYVARRVLNFVKSQGIAKKSENSAFTLLREIEDSGYTPVDDPETMMNQILPAGLAHVYMFDGERMEKRVETNEFKKDLQEAVTGVLGLKKLSKAIELLGTDGRKKNTAIGKLQLRYKPLESSAIQLKRDNEKWLTTLSENNKIIAEKREALQQFDEAIKVAEKELAARREFKEIIARKESLRADKNRVESDQKNRIANILGFQAKAVLYIELIKHREEYHSFIEKEGTTKEVFEGLHQTVIEAIREKGRCICGRPVEEHSPELAKLLSLATLPHDNSLYVTNINSLFERAKDLPGIMDHIERTTAEYFTVKKRLRELENKYTDALKEVENAQNLNSAPTSGYDLHTLNRLRLATEQKIEELIQQNAILDKNITGMDARLRKIRQSDEHNTKVQKANDDLEEVARLLKAELELKQVRARDAIESNMSDFVKKLMGDELSVSLSKDYQLSIHQNDVDETSLLSTGQSVMISFSFLSALLQTVSKWRENSNKNAVVMDAAFSNVDERYIHSASKNVLTQFDQLVFMSFRRQLRKELFTGIKGNVRAAYELSKDSKENVQIKKIALSELDNYIEEEV
jgi:DNA sulfur modification protein DndD